MSILARIRLYLICGVILLLAGIVITDYIRPSYDGVYSFQPMPVVHVKESKDVAKLPVVVEQLPVKRHVLPPKQEEKLKQDFKIPFDSKIISKYDIPALPNGGEAVSSISKEGVVSFDIVPLKPSRFALGGPFEVGGGVGMALDRSWLIEAYIAKELLRTGKLEWWGKAGYMGWGGKGTAYAMIEVRTRFNLF